MVKAAVGGNWGDEGKGKITDMLAEKAHLLSPGRRECRTYHREQLW